MKKSKKKKNVVRMSEEENICKIYENVCGVLLFRYSVRISVII